MRKKTAQAGYALMTLLFLSALVLILLGAEVPRILTQGQREREEELIFRGEEYRRAFARYYRTYGRLPLKLEELAEPRNRLRFIRKLYPDPISGDGRWRLIRVGPMGELVGSVTRQDRIQFQTPGAEQKTEKKAEPQPPPEPPTGGVNLPIIGVASRSPRRSVIVYQGGTTYNAWEFIFDPVADALSRGGAAAAPPPTPTPPAQTPKP